MKRSFCWPMILLSLVAAWPTSGKAKAIHLRADLTGNENSATVTFTLNKPARLWSNLETEKHQGRYTSYFDPTYQELRDFRLLPRSDRNDYKRFPVTRLPNTALMFRHKGRRESLKYCFFPNIDRGMGVYTWSATTNRLEEWRATHGTATNRTFTFEYRYEPSTDCVRYYLDNQYAGRFKDTGRIKSVLIEGGNDATVSITKAYKPERAETLLHPLMPSRANALLKEHARLSLPTGEQVVAGIPMRVFDPRESLDTGCHQETTRLGDFGWNAMGSRTAFANGPNFMAYSVKRKCYSYAYVLCADIPQEGRVPVLGTELTRRASLGSNTVAFDRTTVTNAVASLARGGWIKEVGSLTYRKGEADVTTPLYLVKHRLDFGRILPIVNDLHVYGKDGKAPLKRNNWMAYDYLDFEFVGNGTWSGHKRSSLQIFGATLVESPYYLELTQTERGNIFHNDEKPETGVTLTPRADNTSGAVKMDIFGWDFKPLETRTIPFTLKKAGVPETITIPLDMPEVGWYGFNLTFLDEKGDLLAEHEGAFALLGKDTREAGCVSPYAGWPHGWGDHFNNPHADEVAKMMFKAGLRKTWYRDFPVTSEDNPWKMTMSMWHVGNPPHPACKTREDLDKLLDRKVEEFKEVRRRYPHCRTIQLLHEYGGTRMANEMLNVKAKRGVYKGFGVSDWDVVWCTEACKRLRQEFPECEIMIGNGSSASEMIASLVSRGFDLALAHSLGIESKGFYTIPELSANHEAPGMAWTLKATAKRFGYDLPVNACNEYVFRPEWDVKPDTVNKPGYDYLYAPEFTIRDYIISLAHGMTCISSGHMEDSYTTYYNTMWGAGGHCKAYPYSYPKRVFVALANFTKVFDKATWTRRVETGELSSYIHEFRRDRSVKDFAYACWTPHHEVEMSIAFPSDATVTRVDFWGRSSEVPAAELSDVRVSCGSMATYLIASKSAMGARVLRHWQRRLPKNALPVYKLSTRTAVPLLNGAGRSLVEVPGVFRLRDVETKDRGTVLEAELVKATPYVPEVTKEAQYLKLHRPIRLNHAQVKSVGLWMNGNGSMATVKIHVRDAHGRTETLYPGIVDFDGWHLLTVGTKWGLFERRNKPTDDFEIIGISISSARQNLNPIEMQEITKPVQYGDIVIIPADGKEAEAEQIQRRQLNDVMDLVSDKDKGLQ